MTSVEVFAPGCIGNIGPGLDILGLAVTGLGDSVRVTETSDPGLTIADPGHPQLPVEPARHSAGIAAQAVLARANRSTGLTLFVTKGLPLAGGQGGSAASAVAAAVAVNTLLGSPLTTADLLLCCLEAEETVAGRHLDNIAPSLLGGAVLVRSLVPIDIVPLPVRGELHIVLAHPDQRLETRRGRAVLPESVSRATALFQAAQVAGIVAALGTGDWQLLGRSIDDRIAEPARAPLLPGFSEAKAAALSAGALGCSISGSGPTVFAFAPDLAGAERIRQAMVQAYEKRGIACAARLAQVDERGARVIHWAPVGTSRPLSSPAPSGDRLKQLFRGRIGGGGATLSGVWRFKELVLPEVTDPVTWPEGNTPLVVRSSVNTWSDCPGLSLKHEGMNPTGSFKDRGMTVGMTEARHIGARAVACASTGNTAASMAAYAALAEIPALVLVPAGQVAQGKLGQSLTYGARTLLVRGDFDDCLRLVREAASALGVYLLNSINPLRLLGQKTIIFELLEQLEWQAPEWIVFPAGNLGNTSAFGMALSQARDLGLISQLPRLAAIQAAGAAPFYQSYLEGFAARHRVKAETVATAIRIGDPASFELGMKAIRETDGIVEAVTDEEILAAKAVVDGAGIGCEPASAASVAGVKKLVERGVIRKSDRVVAVLTGHLLKDPVTYSGSNRPIEIDPTISAIELVIRRDPSLRSG
jgi:threonine synthase